MIPCRITMWSPLVLNCLLAAWLAASSGAITVSIDRSDSKPPAPTRSSMIANGWRPLANGYEETLGTNVSPSSNLERNAAPHPVLNKLHEHMAASDKLKSRHKNKPAAAPANSHQDYNPPSILGSFSVFGHAATKARGEAQASHNHAAKHVPSETREYSFLVPPPKDVYRFELDHHRKPILRESTAYVNVRQPQYIPQQIHQPQDPVRAATYFIKGYTSTTNPPSSPAIPPKNRVYPNPYAMQQVLQPPRHQAKPFESQKIGAKPYFQPPGVAIANDFAKDKRVEHEHRPNYDRYQPQIHNSQIHSAGTGSYYSQVNHPPQHYKTSYERDPSFLVHESHEVSYVTAPSVYNGYNLRPSLPYDTLLPPDIYSSTPTPTTLASRLQIPNKYQSNDVNREQDYKRQPLQGSSIKQDQSGGQQEPLPTSGLTNTNTYYVSEPQDLTPPPSAWPLTKSKYTGADINEVLPRVNPPSKFSQEAVATPNQIPQVPKVVYVRPGIHYQSSVLPIDIRPQTSSAPDYETPESISLKHFNEQQFIIQQQLIQRDRQRLAEQERQQQLEIERHQQEELRKRQEELKQLIRQEKQKEEAEQARLEFESVKNRSEQQHRAKEQQQPQAPQPLQPYTIELTEYEIPKVTTQPTPVLTEQSGFGEQPKLQEAQVVEPEFPAPETPQRANQHRHEQVQVQPEQEYNRYREPEVEIRPHRPHKLNREQYRRRKPTTVAYETVPTEVPIQTPETSLPVTLYEEVPVQTTVAPEAVTQPTLANTQRPRLRRPGQPGLRRRRPTTTTQEPVTITGVEEFLKYSKAEEAQQQLDNRRRRIKPTQQTYEESVTERRPNIRKRPGHRNRVNPGEPFEAEIVTEIVHTTVNKDTSDNENNQNNQYSTNHPGGQYYEYGSQKLSSRDEQREEPTEPTVLEYLTEVSRGKIEESTTNEDHNRQQTNGAVTNIPLEDLFIRTEGNYFDRATVSPTSTPATTTTVAPTSPAQPQSAQIPSSTIRPHKMRPMRYGNTTRPRFSIKDYKSRLDYKTRLSQMSSTESPATPAPTHTKQRGPSQKSHQAHIQQQQQQQANDAARETTGRYKYVSRTNYRTTSPAPAREQDQAQDQEATSSTTERSNRFVPKRRPVSGNVYRSRISGTTSSPNRSQKEESENYPRASTARPENVFSSSVRRRPIMKSRLPAQKEAQAAQQHATGRREEYATEMTAEETSFYSAVTTLPTVRLLANEIPLEKGEPTVATGEPKRPVDATEETEKTDGEKAQMVVSRNAEEEKKPGEEAAETKVENEESAGKQREQDDESTTKFAVDPDEEELFAKASLSVADLTSSASALYDKPGLFKAVSPESRVVASHFKITTDEPTLPIEAFFQELTKAN